MSLGLDGINLVLLLLVSGVLSLLASGIVFFEPRATRILSSRMIFLEALVILCLSTFDFLAFVIFWEILCWIICLSGRPPQDEKAKMLTNLPMILNSLGSLVLIFSILTLSFYHKYEHHVFSTSLLDLVSLEFFNSEQQKWVFFSSLLGFAMKIPAIFFHGELTNSLLSSKRGHSMAELGALSLTGVYGFLRFFVPIFAARLEEYAPFIGYFLLIGIVYLVLVVTLESNIKKLIFYGLLSQVNFSLFGVLLIAQQGGATEALTGVVFQMIHMMLYMSVFSFLLIFYENRSFLNKGSKYQICRHSHLSLILFFSWQHSAS